MSEISRIIKAPMSLIDTVLDVVQLSVMMSVFVVVLPLILSVAGTAIGMTKQIPKAISS